MTESLKFPACPACGSREVHIIQRLPDDNPPDRASGHGLKFKGLCTFFACRRCGRDVTDAWAPIQPRTEQ